MSVAYLGLGSNLDDRSENLERACRLLSQSEGIHVVKVSAFHETEPVGGPAQGKFLNAAVEVETSLEPRTLLERCLAVEEGMGRKRTERWGPRTIDIDILLYEERTVDEPGLKVPHPLMHLRRFVLGPLAEIAPGARHPGTGMTVLQMLKQLPEESGDETSRCSGI